MVWVDKISNRNTKFEPLGIGSSMNIVVVDDVCPHLLGIQGVETNWYATESAIFGY